MFTNLKLSFCGLNWPAFYFLVVDPNLTDINFLIFWFEPRRLKLLLKKLRKVAMCRENLSSVRKIGNLIPTSKSSLVVDVCLPAFHHALVNVAGLMGMYNSPCLRIFFGKLHLCFCCSLYFFHVISNRYILEGKELEFYMKKLQKKKGKSAA